MKRPPAADREHAETPRSSTGRAVRMAAMSMGVAGSYMGYMLQRAFLDKDSRKAKLSSAHAKAARRMTRDLKTLRGPAMKLGQALSLHSDLLPDEALAELASLQREAPGMHSSLVRVQFKASVRRFPEDVFAEFDETPFAAASLGQVHHATLRDGSEAAVKIQYPGIREAVANDFKWFRTVSRAAQATGHLPPDAIDELEAQIMAETDYGREADNLERFRRGLAPLTFVRVPQVNRALSKSRVLVMSKLPGHHLEDFLAARPSQALRDLVGERLLDLFYFQLLRLESLHADPHWGNYLFEEDGTIGLVDFGCVKDFSPAFVNDLESFLLFPGDRDTPEFRRQLEKRYALLGRKLTTAVREAMVNFAQRFYLRVFPWQPERENNRFDFGDVRVLKDYARESQALVRCKGVLPEYIFLARAELGMFQTLHRLRARVRTSQIVRRYLRTPRTASTK